MKKSSYIAIAVVGIGLAAGAWVYTAQGNGAAAAEDSAHAQRKVLYWVDPMHPAYKSDKPGKAPDCGMDLVPVYEGQAANTSFPEGTVQIDTGKQQLIGVKYGIVDYEPVTHTIQAVGKVSFDETRIARIHPRIEGWIEKVFVDFTGKQVKKGEPLISLYSPELLATQRELLIAARAQESLGKSELQGVADNANSLLESARERLRLYDISDAQIAELERTRTPVRALNLYSPMDGFVLARNAYEKQKVGPDAELYTIADLSTVWVIADVYEYEMPMMQLGMPATVTLSYLPGRIFRGKVSYIYPQLDATTRTLKVRIEVPNPAMALKPDMFAQVAIEMDHGRELLIPAEAVLDSGNQQVVFVAHDGGYFEPRKVQLGSKFKDRYVVLNGLMAGERIVTSGNFLIDSESQLKSATGGAAGHGHGTETPKETPKETPEPRNPAADEHRQHTAPAPQPPRSETPQVDHSQHGAGSHDGHGDGGRQQ